MFFSMMKFEYNYFLRQPSFIVVSLVMFLLPFLSVAIEQVSIGVSTSSILFNSPFSIALTILIMSFFGMFLVVNFVANTALRNQITKMTEILYTNPIEPISYQLGRFTGSFLIVLTVSLMVPLGLIIGSVMPWLDPVRLAELNLYSYIIPYLIFSLPTCFILSCFFYTAAIRFKSMMAVYLFALVLFALYAMTSGVFAETQNRELMALFDPFALRAFFETTRYWTASQKNTDIVGLSDIVLYNRLLWIFLGSLLIVFFGRLFSALTVELTNYKKNSVSKHFQPSSQENRYHDWGINEFDASYDPSSKWFQFFHLLLFEVKQIVLSPAFIVLLIFAMVVVIAELIDPSSIYGTHVYSLTKFMIELINNAFSLSLLIVITFYSAELVFREKASGMGDIVDSSPVNNIAFYSAKYLAMCVVIISMLLIAAFTTIISQLINGIYNLEITQYFISLLYFVALPFFLLTVVAFLIQTLSPNKYIGMLFFVGFLFIPVAFANLGINHNMASYASSPQLQYSDMNEYGWFMTTQYHYMFYWISLAISLSAVSFAMWRRGPEVNVFKRLLQLPYQLGKAGQVLIMLSLISFVSFGTVIYYNTTQINEFYSKSELERLKIDYEKKFAQFEHLPIISATDIEIDAAIFPSIRKIEVIAQIKYVNKSNQPIDRVLVNFPKHSSVNIQGAKIEDFNAEHRTAWLTFEKPIHPSQTIKLTQFITRQHLGFKDRNEDTSLIQNGTFINNYELLPYFGVNTSNYLRDTHLRRRNGLEELIRANPIDDERYYSESFLGKNASKVNFTATLSTSIEQIAFAPGKLVKYWQDTNRNYFVYKSQQPITNFFNIMSAELNAKSTRFDGVDLSVYYHEAHKYNIENMLSAAKDALEYYQSIFTPYQFKQLNIIEFPGYTNFAQSYANTIAYSERLGFVTDLSNPKNIDTVYYVTAHEIAHQWFGHQLEVANIQGAQILIEGLSQYAALQLMQKTYGKAKIRKFLRYELDKYLTGRANEEFKELPLMIEEGQDYIYYQKASIVFMAIADRIGAEALNRAIKYLLQKFTSDQSTYATTIDLLNLIKNEAPISTHEYIENQFKQIQLFNIELAVVSLEDNQTRIALDAKIEKLDSDSFASQKTPEFEELVDVVLFKNNPDDFSAQLEIIYTEKLPMSSGNNTIVIDIKSLPAETQAIFNQAYRESKVFVGIDPFIRYIDVNSNDNVRKVH